MRTIARCSLLALVAWAGAACSDGSKSGSEDAAEPAERAPADGPVREWVAVFLLDPYPEAVRQRFIADAGPHIFEGPAACFDGLAPVAGGSDRSVLGLVASSEAELRDAIATMDGDPVVVGEFASNCVD